MGFKEKEKQQGAVRLICPTCGKPVADRPRSNVTRFLFQESRCMCLPVVSDDKQPHAQPASAVSDELSVASGSSNGQIASDEKAALAPGAPGSAGSPDGRANPSGSGLADNSQSGNLGDRFEVVSLLGQGGMGAVYKARDKKLQKTFAVKVLNSQLVEDRAAVKRFEQEARAASSLTHPNLAAVYDFGMGESGAPYLVMDYLDGDNLGDVLKREGYLDVPRSLDIFLQVCEAVAHAHKKGVIHRDIKPNNIILTQGTAGGDFVKLVDFGIAKVLPGRDKQAENLTQTGEIFGSPLYMSPEQCLGNKLDARSDIYAFGCVMYETLTGKSPFSAENPIRTILKHINDVAVPLSSLKDAQAIPGDLEHIVMRCLEKDPDSRYQSMDDLFKDLECVRDGKPLKIKKPVKARSTGSRKNSPVWLSAVAVSLVLLLTLLASLSVVHKASSPNPSVLNPSGDAQNLDNLSYRYFVSGEYEKAIPLLEFGIKTYKENGREDTFLADNLQHIGKCYMMLGQYKKAQPYYEDALKIYRKFGNYQGSQMGEAVRDYAFVLVKLGRSDRARQIEAEITRSR